MALPIVAIAKGLISIAPTIAGWLGGDKAEGAAKEVVSIAQQITGASPQDAVNQVLANPEHQLEFMLALECNKSKFDELYLADRQNARKMHAGSLMPPILSIMLTVMMISIVYALFTMADIAQSNRELLSTVLGVVIREWAGSMHYWHGTTRGSSDKNQWRK